MREAAVPLTEIHDAALLDLDGVVYLGQHVIRGAPEALGKARAAGMRLAFVTNNASRTPATIASHLSALGIEADPAEIVTSAQAAARLIAVRVPPGSPVLVVGAMGLRQAVRDQGLRPVTTAADQPTAVVQGYAPDVSYGLLAEGALAVMRGAFFVATNSDATWPSTRGPLPGNGSLIQVIRNATGVEPEVAGKPHPPLLREAVRSARAKRPVFVGDRLDTDIAGAAGVGMDSMLVLTGVTKPVDLLLAPPSQRPTYLSTDVTGLLTAHPGVDVDRDAYRCGGWTIRSGGGVVEIHGSGTALDGLRALCAAIWSSEERMEPAAMGRAIAGIGMSSVCR